MFCINLNLETKFEEVEWSALNHSVLNLSHTHSENITEASVHLVQGMALLVAVFAHVLFRGIPSDITATIAKTKNSLKFFVLGAAFTCIWCETWYGLCTSSKST